MTSKVGVCLIRGQLFLRFSTKVYPDFVSQKEGCVLCTYIWVMTVASVLASTTDTFSICDAELLSLDTTEVNNICVWFFMQKTVALHVNTNSNVKRYVAFCVCVKNAKGLL